MKCPHCLVAFSYQPAYEFKGKDVEGRWGIASATCPECKRLILEFVKFDENSHIETHVRWLHPKVATRPAPPAEVPDDLAGDYREACLVLSDSPKASAALTRRCLQHLLREYAKVKPSNLDKEIDEVIPDFPSHLATSLDAVRQIGNFATHPIKATSSGEVTEVEPGEAEWNLDVLEGLFDFYFVQPAFLQAKKDALNKKLADAGKPTID